MRSISKLFGRSPFIPMQMHMEKVAECVALIPEIMTAYRNGASDAVASLSHKISGLEHEADDIKHDIRNNLPRGMFMPVDRANLLRIVAIQDSIADRAENISVIMTFKQARVFEGFDQPFDTFLNSSLKTFELSHATINRLDELLESGFSGYEANSVRELVDQVALTEHETDVHQHELVRILLANEDSISYGDFYLWTRIIRQIAAIADRAENLAMEVRTTLESN